MYSLGIVSEVGHHEELNLVVGQRLSFLSPAPLVNASFSDHAPPQASLHKVM